MEARYFFSVFSMMLSLTLINLFSLEFGCANLGSLVISLMTSPSVRSKPQFSRLMSGFSSGRLIVVFGFATLFGVGAKPVDVGETVGVVVPLKVGGSSVFPSFRLEPAAAGPVLIR